MSSVHAFLSGPFVHGFLFVVLALFPVVNPLGMAPIFLRYTSGTDDATRAKLARRVAYNSFALALVSLVAGSLVLRFFGLSLPAVQIAGGIVVAATGWRLLNQGQDDPENRAPAASVAAVMSGAFYPLTLPLTVGPGSIAVMLTIGSSVSDVLRSRAALLEELGGILGVAATAIVIYLCYRYAETILRRLGDSGVNVLLRLSAFILLCIGVQIAVDGARTLFVVPRF
ncbi:MAG TPA: MarC family protein [Candidatus Sulfotelmatobacter sp.]|nr:MarC family protein [Candidatus Sulfotelmatobacter sp.]